MESLNSLESQKSNNKEINEEITVGASTFYNNGHPPNDGDLVSMAILEH